MLAAAGLSSLGLADTGPPPPCNASLTEMWGACTLSAPADEEFASICNPGTVGHAGGAEKPVGRCGGLYDDGAFRCACCGAPLFLAATKFLPKGDGWPAFHGNSIIDKNVCSPGGTEVVCSQCGSHLGDYFASIRPPYLGTEYYCIDGVCLLPPGADEGKVCQPPEGAAATVSEHVTEKRLRAAMPARAAAPV